MNNNKHLIFGFQYNANDLSSMVTEQLSLSDFQEIALSSLPPNLNNFEKKILSGKYCLQVIN
jgi:hypothetical protein